MDADQRREELEAKTPQELAEILTKLNPFGGYSARAIAAHKDSYIESILAWEGMG